MARGAMSVARYFVHKWEWQALPKTYHDPVVSQHQNGRVRHYIIQACRGRAVAGIEADHLNFPANLITVLKIAHVGLYFGLVLRIWSVKDKQLHGYNIPQNHPRSRG